MEKAETIKAAEQVNVLLQGEEAELFREYMGDEAILAKSAAGYKLIVEGLRRWKRSRELEAEVA